VWFSCLCRPTCSLAEQHRLVSLFQAPGFPVSKSSLTTLIQLLKWAVVPHPNVILGSTARALVQLLHTSLSPTCMHAHSYLTKVSGKRWPAARSAGVSNFSLEQIIELLEWAVVPPSVVQRRSDLFTQDRAVQRLCLTQGIRYTAYSTLGTQYWGKQHPVNPVLNNEGVKAIAHKHGLSPAQVR
jgi:hypothetical protein